MQHCSERVSNAAENVRALYLISNHDDTLKLSLVGTIYLHKNQMFVVVCRLLKGNLIDHCQMPQEIQSIISGEAAP